VVLSAGDHGRDFAAGASGTARIQPQAVSNLRGASVNQWGFFYMARDNNTAAS
jgi:hypothetical protein